MLTITAHAKETRSPSHATWNKKPESCWQGQIQRTNPAIVPSDILVNDVGLSDHKLVSWSISMTPPTPAYVMITRRKWQHFDTAFLAELSESEPCSVIDPVTDTSADDLADTFNSVISGFLISMLLFQSSLCKSVLISLGLTTNAVRLDIWPDTLRSMLPGQRISKPGAQPYIRLGNCQILCLPSCIHCIQSNIKNCNRLEDVGCQFQARENSYEHEEIRCSSWRYTGSKTVNDCQLKHETFMWNIILSKWCWSKQGLAFNRVHGATMEDNRLANSL